MKASSIEAIATALIGAGVQFIVVGGVAVVAHGYGRMTADLDLVIRLDGATIHRAFDALATLGYRPRVPVTAEGFADPGSRAKWVEEKGMTVLAFDSAQYPDTFVDVFAREPFQFNEEYDHALIVEIAPRVPLRIVGLETLLRMKRGAGRPQDLADVAELEALHGESDV